MPKIGTKSNDKTSGFDARSCKSIMSNEHAYYWPQEDPFGSQHSNKSDANSKSSDSGYSQKVSAKRSKSCSNNSKHSPNKLKSSAKPMSRFVKTLIVENIDTNSGDNSSENNENELINDSINNSTEEDINISDVSSPIKPSMPSIDSNSSPIGHKVVNPIIDSLIRKSIVNFFDDSVIDLEKNIKRSKIRKIDIPLRLRALSVLKNMKRSRIEFCHRNSLQIKDNKSKPLVLKVIKIETEFGFSFFNSNVLNDEYFEENTPIILVLKEELSTGLKPTTNYKINVFRKWDQREICSQTYIFNAFNIEFIESDKSPDDERNPESDYSVIWQKDKP